MRLFLLLFFSLFFGTTVESSIFLEKEKKAYDYLDKLALESGTDKSSIFHNYTKVYASYFDPIRDLDLKFLEIGICRGESVKLWEKYFVNSELHFIDINPDTVVYHSSRSFYHYIDQSNFSALQKFAQNLGYTFDIIIDDGGHTMEQQIVSFLALFPFVSSGGFYIIEDLHTSYWKAYGGFGQVGQPVAGPGTCTEFLKKLVDDLNYTAGVTTCADFEKIPPTLKKDLNAFQASIDSMHFYQSICIIRKK